MITYFIRNQKAGYSLHKQSMQLISEVSKYSDVEIFELLNIGLIHGICLKIFSLFISIEIEMALII